MNIMAWDGSFWSHRLNLPRACWWLDFLIVDMVRLVLDRLGWALNLVPMAIGPRSTAERDWDQIDLIERGHGQSKPSPRHNFYLRSPRCKPYRWRMLLPPSHLAISPPPSAFVAILYHDVEGTMLVVFFSLENMAYFSRTNYCQPKAWNIVKPP